MLTRCYGIMEGRIDGAGIIELEQSIRYCKLSTPTNNHRLLSEKAACKVMFQNEKLIENLHKKINSQLNSCKVKIVV